MPTFGGGALSGGRLGVAAAVVDPALVSLFAGDALPAGVAPLLAFVATTVLFLQVGKLMASRHGIRANRRSIKVGYA